MGSRTSLGLRRRLASVVFLKWVDIRCAAKPVLYPGKHHQPPPPPPHSK